MVSSLVLLLPWATKLTRTATDMTLFGYDQGVFGGVIVTNDFLDTLNLAGDEHTSLLGTVVALYDIGCFFGAVIVIWLGEALGRKKSVLVGTTIMTVGAVLQISAYSVAQMIVGRIIAGIGNGMHFQTSCLLWTRILMPFRNQHIHSSCLANRNFTNEMAW